MKTHLEVQKREDIRRDLAQRIREKISKEVNLENG